MIAILKHAHLCCFIINSNVFQLNMDKLLYVSYCFCFVHIWLSCVWLLRALHRCCLSVLHIPTRMSETRDSLLWENVREWCIRVPAVQTHRSSLRVSRTLPGHCRAAEPRVGDGGWIRAVAMGVLQGDRHRLDLHLHPQVWLANSDADIVVSRGICDISGISYRTDLFV